MLLLLVFYLAFSLLGPNFTAGLPKPSLWALLGFVGSSPNFQDKSKTPEDLNPAPPVTALVAKLSTGLGNVGRMCFHPEMSWERSAVLWRQQSLCTTLPLLWPPLFLSHLLLWSKWNVFTPFCSYKRGRTLPFAQVWMRWAEICHLVSQTPAAISDHCSQPSSAPPQPLHARARNGCLPLFYPKSPHLWIFF